MESKIKKTLSLMRIKHYIKNLLIFFPVVFGGKLLNANVIIMLIFGMLSFCLVASAVYIFNDIEDVEKDRLHPVKCKRPIASGDISIWFAYMLFVICVLMSSVLAYYLAGFELMGIILLYLLLNILYSKALKNVPIIDIMILASGFVLRVFFGGVLTNTEISYWMFLVVLSGSLFMGLGKRRNELVKIKSNNTREVLKFYNYAFLDKYMYVCVTLIVVFYALWTVDVQNKIMLFTVPILMAVMMKYSINIEDAESDGDPIEVILKDKVLILLLVIYGLVSLFSLYVI